MTWATMMRIFALIWALARAANETCSEEGSLLSLNKKHSFKAPCPKDSQIGPPPATGNPFFGGAVSLRASRLAVSQAALPGALSEEKGRVYVYQKPASGTWTLQQTLTADDQSLDTIKESFGTSVSLAGETLVASSNVFHPCESPGACPDGAGILHVFKEENGQWVEDDNLKPADVMASDNFGIVLSGTDKWLVAGTQRESEPGFVYVFKYDHGWSGATKLSSIVPGDWFGTSVAVSGDRIIVGAPLSENSRGAAYIFAWGSFGWNQEVKLYDENVIPGSEFDKFGVAVAIGSNWCAVSETDTNYHPGKVYIFQLQEDDTWPLLQMVEARVEADMQYYFGSTLDMSTNDDLLVIGSEVHYPKNMAGSIMVLQRNANNVWETIDLLPPNEWHPESYRYGKYLSLDRQTQVPSQMAVGGISWKGNNPGVVHVAYLDKVRPHSVPSTVLLKTERVATWITLIIYNVVKHVVVPLVDQILDGTGFKPWKRPSVPPPEPPLNTTTLPIPTTYSYEWGYTMSELSSLCYSAEYGIDCVRSFNCTFCKDLGFKIDMDTMDLVTGRNLWDDDATAILVAKVHSTAPESLDFGCLVAVRGSRVRANWVMNFRFFHDPSYDSRDTCPGCRVETGFNGVWQAAADKVKEKLLQKGCAPRGKNSLIYVTGHSLGGAVAAIATMDLYQMGYDPQLINFEAPRPGNAAFAYWLKQTGKPQFRITFNADPVTAIPPAWVGYSGHGQEMYFCCLPNEGPLSCDGFWDLRCSYQFGFNQWDSEYHCLSPILSSPEEKKYMCDGPDTEICCQAGRECE